MTQLSFTEYPTNWAPHKPLQSISEELYLQLLSAGRLFGTKKYNGNRCHVLVFEDSSIHIFSRSGTLDWTEYLPTLVKELEQLNLPKNSFLDAELYNPSDETVEGIQYVIASGNSDLGSKRELEVKPAIAFFDIITHKGNNVSQESFLSRRTLLKEILEPYTSPISRVHIAEELTLSEDYISNINTIKDLNIEGFVVNDINAPHNLNFLGNTKRGKAWKIKLVHTEDFLVTKVILNKNPDIVEKLGVSALEINRVKDGKLISMGKIGSFHLAFNRKEAVTAELPFVVEVSHFGVNERNILEFPVILRKRDDLLPDFKKQLNC